jgi:crotonobetainyl-CoA:carnitine CoA-transferase CaiB-like acyl-CoA transferase
VNLALLASQPLPAAKRPQHGTATNPLVGAYRTADGRWLELAMLQPGRYWPEFCRCIGHPELATDERFDSTENLMSNAAGAADIVADVIASRNHEDWVQAFDAMEGQWSTAQNAWEVGQDISLRANGYISGLTDADGKQRELVANPVQFDEMPVQLRRGPQFAEHTDDVLRELGFSEDDIIELKITGAIT